MASKFFIQYRSKYAKIGILEHHKKLMREHYDFLSYKIKSNVLIGTGWITSDDYLNRYKIELRCVAGREPYCKILEPERITPLREVHMYEDHSLCLNYPPDMKWSGRTPIYLYTIPWIIEWIHYYELFLINGGKWEGPESPVHFTENDKNINEDASN